MAGHLVVHVVGARPNFMKAAPVIDALARLDVGQEVVHTGQHYDQRLSDVFFEDLRIPPPRLNLGIGSGSHAVQTAAAMVDLEKAFLDFAPAMVVVYGDVNSTIAAALVAAKLLIPVAHVEAGLRSSDRTMPEETNRVLTDQLADLLFTTSPEAMAHLGNEGIDVARMHFVGNPMIDTVLHARGRMDPDGVRRRLGLLEPCGIVTLHRPANVDDRERVERIVTALAEVSEAVPLVFPVHPRGRDALVAAGLGQDGDIRVVDPLGYVDFISLVSDAPVVITDSGGIQEETTVLGIPCVTVRPNTERPITISHGTNRLAEPEELAVAVKEAMSDLDVATPQVPPLWDGNAGARIARGIVDWLATRHGMDPLR